MSPPAVLVLAFAVLIAIGTVLLSLPLSSRSGEWTPALDALFTATSATCVTGLVVVDTGTYWSGFGQGVILALIQAGGFGIMAGSTLLLSVLIRRRVTLQDRLVTQASLGGLDLGDVTRLVRRLAIFTLVLEGAGALVLGAAFLLHDSTAGGGSPLGIWWGIFHAVSAFNNAGFDLTGDYRSLAPFADHGIVLTAIGALVLIGGLGYAIVADAVRLHSWRRLALETKIVLGLTAVLVVGGALLITTTEWGNPETLGALPAQQRPLNGLFEAVVLRTSGFSTLSLPALLDETLFVVIVLMFIGGASGSTAGGIKVNTLGVLLSAVWSSARGRPSAAAFGRRIQHAVVYRALSVALFSTAFVVLVGFGLTIATDERFVRVMFETVSAFGTVGASTGITPDLGTPARLMLIAAMFVGRLGPITLVLALTARARHVPYRPAVGSVRIG